MSLVVSGGLVGVTPPSGAAIPSHVTTTAARMEARKRRDSTESQPRSSPGRGEDHAPNKIFVGGISFQTTPEKLRAYFAPYGTILDVMVLKDQATNVSSGKLRERHNPSEGYAMVSLMNVGNVLISCSELLLFGFFLIPYIAFLSRSMTR